MRILLISEVTSRMLGGVPAETAHFIRGFAARGHAVALLGDRPLPSAPQADHYTLTMPAGERFVAETQRAIDAFRPSVVHVMGLFPRNTLRLAPLLSGSGLPWVFTCHAVSPYERTVAGLHGSEWLHYAARALRYARNTLGARLLLRSGVAPQVIVHSAYVADIVRRYGCPADRIANIPLGFESRHARGELASGQVTGAPRLVTVAGLAHTKGQHDVLRALPAIVARHPELVYTIVGEPRERTYVGYLREQVRALGLDEHVRFALSVSEAEKQALLRDADLYLQPSHEEGFCLSFVEAAAVVPRLVGTRTGAIAQVSAGDEGIRVVSPRRPDELAQAALDLLGRTLPLDLMKRREARLEAQLSWSRYVDEHEALYARLLHVQPQVAVAAG
ncbi:MAG: glycosyltransferase family 4 protein [Rhizobacter sp.]